MKTSPDSHAIRALAYRLWEQSGRRDGHAQEHWFEAERQLLGTKRAASNRVDEAAKESFPASDAPASGLPDEPPVNADEKWDAASRRKRSSGKASGARKLSPSEKTVAAAPSNDTPKKLGSRDAPGG